MSYIFKVIVNIFKYNAEKSIKTPASVSRTEQKLLGSSTLARSIPESRLQLPVAGDPGPGDSGTTCRVCRGGRRGRLREERKDRRRTEKRRERQRRRRRGGGGGESEEEEEARAAATRVACRGRGEALTCGAAGLRLRSCELQVRSPRGRVLRRGCPGGRALPAELQPRPQPRGAALLRLLPALCRQPCAQATRLEPSPPRPPHCKRVTSEVAVKQDFVFQDRSHYAVQAGLELAVWTRLASN